MTDDKTTHDRVAELHPEAAAVLADFAASARLNAHLLPIEEARRNQEADYAGYPGEDVAEVRELTVASVPARLYRPATAPVQRAPVILYFHGGGWVVGTIESYDGVCRALANASGLVVVSIGYRRGPEARFPAAVDDCYAATVEVLQRFEELGLDPALVAVAGDSVGGNLVAAVTLLARDRGGPAIATQLLVCPVTTTDLDVGFDPDLEGFLLYRDEMQWHQDNYLTSPNEKNNPLVSPLDNADLTGLPPATIITAGCDPLYPQGVLYAQALGAAGVPAEHLQWPGVLHGFFLRPATFQAGREAVDVAGAKLRTALGLPPLASGEPTRG